MTSRTPPAMSTLLPMAVVGFGSLVLFGSIAFVFSLVIASLVTGGSVDFGGGPEIADAAAASVTLFRAA